MFTDQFLDWKDDQQNNYTRVAGVDDQIIYYDIDSSFDYPESIKIYLNPNLADATVLNRGFKFVIPTFGYRIYGTTGGTNKYIQIIQAGPGVTTATLAQIDVGRVPPMILEFFWDPQFDSGKYRSVKYTLDTSLGDRGINGGNGPDFQIQGQSFSSHKKYAFWYGGYQTSMVGVNSGFIPRNAIVFPDEAILIGTGILGTDPASQTNAKMSFGLTTIGDGQNVFTPLLPNIPFSSIDPDVSDSGDVFFKSRGITQYGYYSNNVSSGRGFILKSDSAIGAIRLASPAGIVRRITNNLSISTEGNHILLVPYIVQGSTVSSGDDLLPPGRNFGGTSGAPDLYVTGGGGGGTQAFDTNLKKTLFVDENGNNTTAAVGDINRPWSNIYNAVDYIKTNNLNGYTVHVFKGDYLVTQGIDFNTYIGSVNIYFELGARVNFTPSVSGSVMFTVSGATAGFELNISGEYKNSNANDQGIINISNNGKLFLNNGNKNCELNLINLSVTNVTNLALGNMISTNATYASSGTCSYNISNCFLKLSDTSSQGSSTLIYIPNNTASVTEKIAISNSTLLNSGLYKSDAAISVLETQSEISITNSVIANANVTPIGINQPNLFYISNVIFFDTNTVGTGFTFSDSGTGGTTKIYIGARCVSNFKLPTSSNDSFLNMTGGILDCQLDLGTVLPSI